MPPRTAVTIPAGAVSAVRHLHDLFTSRHATIPLPPISLMLRFALCLSTRSKVANFRSITMFSHSSLELLYLYLLVLPISPWSDWRQQLVLHFVDDARSGGTRSIVAAVSLVGRNLFGRTRWIASVRIEVPDVSTEFQATAKVTRMARLHPRQPTSSSFIVPGLAA